MEQVHDPPPVDGLWILPPFLRCDSPLEVIRLHTQCITRPVKMDALNLPLDLAPLGNIVIYLEQLYTHLNIIPQGGECACPVQLYPLSLWL